MLHLYYSKKSQKTTASGVPTHIPHPFVGNLNGIIGAHRRFSVVPAWESGFCILHVRPHGPLHETPDHEGDDQHHAEGVDPRRGLEEEIVDHERILEEGEVALDTVLPLLCPK
jgi:hypothetical protein